MGIEGSLVIQITLDGSAVKSVSIDSSRPVHACRVFNGKPVADALKTLPLLFSVCGTAQVCAGVRACEQALALEVSQQTQLWRDRLVAMETLREHLWRTLLDWPVFIGEVSESKAMAAMVSIHGGFSRGICVGGNLFEPGSDSCQADRAAIEGALRQLSNLLERSLFAMAPEHWLEISDSETLMAWVERGETVAARLLAHVIEKGWSGAGDCNIEPLPILEASALHQRMGDDRFISQPRWGGHCCESTVLTRNESPLLKALIAQDGSGLLARLVARLTEIARLSGWLLSMEDTPGVDPVAAAHPGSNPGIGQSTAARGQLFHRVALEGEQIARYQILAPTEWNFHPRGVVAQALASLHGSSDEIEQQARLLINAIDPCVGYELKLV